MATNWNDINASSYSIPVQEGDIFVFPSKLCHSVVNEDIQYNEVESFKTIEDLRRSRFCVVGDALLTRKDTKSYDRLLMPIENWRKF